MNDDKIINFLFEIASLRRLIRNHHQVIEQASDNISDHSFRVTIIGMILARLEDCDSNKVMRMCLFHDLAEARTGDANFINQQYVESCEEKVTEDQVQGLPIADEISDILKEFKENDSQEAKTAKDADLLDQMVLQQEYFYTDKENRDKWHDHTEKSLVTDSAKMLAKKIREANPFEWIYELGRQKSAL
jgi:putative hydrolase of HD superfamily